MVQETRIETAAGSYVSDEEIVPAPKPDEATVTATVGGEPVKYAVVYDTKTGVPSNVFRGFHDQNLSQVLQKKRPDGTPVFSTRQTVKPVQGTYKCFLHQDDPSRELYDRMGFAVCPKDNLASEYQARRHAQKRHKSEWEAVESMRQDKEKEDTKLTDQALKAVLVKFLESQGEQSGGYTCDICGKECKNAIGLAGHKKSHKE